jgi:hypothetical protein
MTTCGTSCVETDTDPNHCGMCNNACAGGRTCTAGVCDCPPETPLCGDRCADFDTDSAHCGMCDNPCGMGEVCEGGECVAGEEPPDGGTDGG